MNRGNGEQSPSAAREAEKPSLFKKRKPEIDVEEGTEEVQSKLMKPDFQHWAKLDPLRYNRTFQ